MKDELYENVKEATFILWQYANNSDNALGLWNCTEEIALVFESNNIKTIEDINGILELGTNSPIYIDFVRQITYRIYRYTENSDKIQNWFVGEKALADKEWKEAIMKVVAIFSAIPNNPELIKAIRSDVVRSYYITKINEKTN